MKSRMPELGTYGSVGDIPSNRCFYPTNIDSDAYIWYGSWRSAGADARQPREDRGKDRTALYLDLERNSSYDTGIPDLFRTAQPGSHIQRHDSRRALHVIKYRRIHCGNRSLRYPCY